MNTENAGDLVDHRIIFHKTNVTKVWMVSFWIMFIPYAETAIARAQQIVFNQNLQKRLLI
jgi:hypothetical protein